MAWPLTGRDSETGRIRAALDDPARQAVALVGRAGVGTTRLLAVASDHARARGWHVHSVVASPALGEVPFGAMAPLASELVGDDVGDRLAMIAGFERELLAGADGTDLMVAVDGAQWLDEASVALLQRLSTHRRVRLVVALRTAPQFGTTAWSLATTDTETIDVAPLSRDAHDQLIGAVCDRPVTREAGQALWDHTAGRPRDLELLLDAIDRSELVDPDGEVWHWAGDAVDSPGLRSLTATHLSGVSDAARRAFELVALGSPLPPAVADVVLDEVAREELERAELIDGTGLGDAAVLRPARPLAAMGVVGRLGPTTRRRLLSTLAEVVPAPGADWTLRHARWAVESGRPVVGDLTDLARTALTGSDLDLAAQLGRSATQEASGDVDAHLVLAEALRRSRRGDEALSVLEVAAAGAGTDEQRTEVAILQAQVHSLLNRDPHAALRRLDDALAVVTDADARRRLVGERDLARSFVDPVDSVGEQRGPDRTASERLTDGEIEELLVVALLRCLHLDLDGIDPVLRQLRDSVSEGGSDPFVHARIAVCEHLALVGRGRVGDAHAGARVALETATARGEPLGMWALSVAFSGPLTGDLDAAAVAAFDADRSFRAVDPFGLRPLSAAIGATAAWQAGRPAMAASLAEIAERSDSADPRVVEIAAHRRRAWQAVVGGDLAGGAQFAARSGQLAMEAGHRLWGVVGLHESVRLGAPAIVMDDLASAVAATDSALVRTFAAHAAALAREAADDLDGVATDLARLGCPLLAAEAAAQAAHHATDATASARSATRAEIWWSRCSGRVPPALTVAPRGLTARQHEIARLAALGLASQEIADRLVVARRTVDNHLRSVYRRLDVGGRDELASVIGPAVG